MSATNQAQIEAGRPNLDCLTPWMEGGDAQPEEAARRHALFRELALGLLQRQYPWLVRILERAGGHVLALQGRFFVALPSDISDWIEIPELSASLHLVPWQEEGQETQ
jgi:hypothetical protein